MNTDGVQMVTRRRVNAKVGQLKIDLAKINFELVASKAKEFFKTEGMVGQQMTAALFAYYEKNTPAGCQLICEHCEGVCDAREKLAACPYCGTLATSELDEKKEEPVVTMQEERKKEPMTNGDAHHVNNGQRKLGQSSLRDIVHAIPDGPMIHKKETDDEYLDRLVSEIIQLKGCGWAVYWEIGTRIKEIRTRNAWIYRREVDSKTGKYKRKYKTADLFFQEEVGISARAARAFEDVVTHFSREDIAKFGGTKLAVLLSATPEERTRLKEKLEAFGLTKRELQEEVKESNEGRKKITRRDGIERKLPSTEKEKALAKARNTSKIYQGPYVQGVQPKLATKITEHVFWLRRFGDSKRVSHIERIRQTASGHFEVYKEKIKTRYKASES